MLLPKININRIPFSRYGSYVAVSDEKSRLIIYNARLRFTMGSVFEVLFLKDGNVLEYTAKATPQFCEITTNCGTVIFYIKDDNTIVFQSEGVDIYFRHLVGKGYGFQFSENEYRTINVNQCLYSLFHICQGEAKLGGNIEDDMSDETNRNQDFFVRFVNGKSLFSLTMDNTEPKSITEEINTQEDLKLINKEWESFVEKVSLNYDIKDNYNLTSWYNIWSCFVRAKDVYKYDVVLMSKKFMSSVWSWDHCFNALALAKVDFKVAYEQFLAPFVLQGENGVLPDMWNPNSETIYGVTKPPVHGWCFSKLMDIGTFSNDDLKRVYGYLEKWTNWWFEYRDSDNDGIPEYPQGCDCGWDNSTLFDKRFFVEAPDLSAYLILQMKCLAKISKKLIDTEKENYWNDRADDLMKKLISHSWDGERFLAKQSRTHLCEKKPTSLLSLMPLILGNNLDKDILEKSVKILEKDFLTEHGFATESYKSEKYESDGYWRGPIWAPVTYMLIDGLRNASYYQLAETVARKFCNMAKNKARGNYENYDALTGEGLRAPGYTWTAAVYLLLSDEYGD